MSFGIGKVNINRFELRLDKNLVGLKIKGKKKKRKNKSSVLCVDGVDK